MRKWVARQWHRFLHYAQRHSIESLIVALFVTFFCVYFAKDMFYTIPSGCVGVLWERFFGGTVYSRYIPEGFHVIMPWNKIFVYDARVQTRNLDLDALSVDGLTLKIDLAYQYEIVKNNAPYLHDFVGPTYADVLLDPDVAAKARDIFSQNTPQEIFSDRRKEIQAEILADVQKDLLSNFNPQNDQGKPGSPINYVVIEGVLVRSIKLPPSVVSAIDSKNEQQQVLQEYDYRILREEKEALRKRIEALGIRDFQNTISGGITENYLRWQGIQATLDLAKSNNAKIVVIGGGKDGLPLILGNQDGISANAADTSAPPAVAVAPTPEPSSTPRTPYGALLQKLGLAPNGLPLPASAPSPHQ